MYLVPDETKNIQLSTINITVFTTSYTLKSVFFFLIFQEKILKDAKLLLSVNCYSATPSKTGLA
jgi:hypothetical protein